MEKTVLLIATFDTKEEEALFLAGAIAARQVKVLKMDAGILAPPSHSVDIPRERIAAAGGRTLEELLAEGNKGRCIENMIVGAKKTCRELYEQGLFQGVIAIGGGQGTNIGAKAMQTLPVGVPKLMISTVASGHATFGPFVGTKDVTMMHSVTDIQGLNFLTRRILENAAGAICGMVDAFCREKSTPLATPLALTMMGTTTPGALHCKKILEEKGFEVVAFHQNGTGGIAMEDMIREGAFRGVLDLSLHEIGDRFVGGLHGAIREDRLEAAGAMGLPQVVAPGGINYVVLGPLASLSAAWRQRKLIVHNPELTLVRLSPEELQEVGKLVAKKLNRARGPVHVFLPLAGFCYPDREDHPLWEPEGNQAFIDALKGNLNSAIPLTELNLHINDPAFSEILTGAFLEMFENFTHQPGGTHALPF